VYAVFALYSPSFTISPKEREILNQQNYRHRRQCGEMTNNALKNR
jgi:hypothetical protein